MQIKTGYIYHIKDEFFEKYSSYNLMNNHENGRTRPTYFTIKDKNILWFIPLSTKIKKYENIINYKKKKYGSCHSILIKNILSKKEVILIQNAFPTLEKYISHVHTKNGVPVRVSDAIINEVIINFNNLLKLKEKGIDLFFCDITKLKEELDNEYLLTKV